MKTTASTKTQPPLRAFFGRTATKNKFVKRVRQHRLADQIRRGYGYWSKDTEGTFRGCAVGCTLHSNDHSAYERELGVPRPLAHLEDMMFERMPAAQALDWPTEFLEAIPVGADLRNVTWEFLHWLLVDEQDGVIKYARTDESKTAIRNVAALLARKIAGDEPTAGEWDTARRAAAEEAEEAARWAAEEADEAARWAAEAARWEAARWEAEAARWAAEAARWEAARWEAARWAAAAAARWAAAEEEEFWVKASRKLLDLLRGAKTCRRSADSATRVRSPINPRPRLTPRATPSHGKFSGM